MLRRLLKLRNSTQTCLEISKIRFRTYYFGNYGNVIKCIKCGLCCRSAGLIDGFPEPTINNACIHLTESNECSIYDTRPDVCRSEKVYAADFSHLTKSHFIHMNRMACIGLMNLNNHAVPENF